MELIIALIGTIILPVILFFIGKDEGNKKAYNQKIEDEKRRIVDQYNDWANKSYDNGIHALSQLGLGLLQTDKNIRDVIHKLTVIHGRTPLHPYEASLKNVNLFDFFEYIRTKQINVYKMNLKEIIEKI